MSETAIYIAQVKSKELVATVCNNILEIEWFETRKHILTRESEAGITLHLRLEDRKEWRQGDGLYADDELMARINIKKCLTIQFHAADPSAVADFSYYIGNRHLPIFLADDQEALVVPYDGRLYEQLLFRYGHQVQLLENQLLSERLLRHIIKNKANEN